MRVKHRHVLPSMQPLSKHMLRKRQQILQLLPCESKPCMHKRSRQNKLHGLLPSVGGNSKGESC